MKYRVTNCGKVGLVTDIEPEDVPPEAWTSVTNAEFIFNYARPAVGYEDMATPVGTPYAAVYYAGPTNAYWVYPTDSNGNGTVDKLYLWDGANHVDVTRASGDYTGFVGDYWSGFTFNGVCVMNNGQDAPQYITYTTNSDDFADLIYDGVNTWTDQNYSAKSLVAFGRYIFAFNITDGGSQYPHMVHHSDVAPIGGLPTSWNPTAENDANRFELTDTPGYVLTGLPLKDTLFIYKEDAVYTARFIGGSLIFDVQKFQTARGALCQFSVCYADDGNKHFVVGRDIIYVHDGATVTEVGAGQIQDYLFANLNGTYYDRTQCLYDPETNLVWIAFPNLTSTGTLNEALTYNTLTGAWGHRTLPDVYRLTLGVVATVGLTWNDYSTQPWNTETGRWNDRQYKGSSETIIGTGASLLKFGGIQTYGGSNPTVILEKTGIKLDEYSDWHMIKSVYPRVKNGAIAIQVGVQDRIGGAVDWSASQSFDPATDTKVDVRKTGTYGALRFIFSGSQTPELAGYEVEYERAGKAP